MLGILAVSCRRMVAGCRGCSGVSSLPVRLWTGVMVFAATFVSYLTRININISIISMTENADRLCDDGHGHGNSTGDGEQNYVLSPKSGNDIFCWTDYEKSLIKGAFYYGYIFLQVPGGRLSELYGTRKVLGLATLAATVLTFVTPTAARCGALSVMVVRALLGLAQGVLFPSLYPILLNWVPEEEFSKFVGVSTMGGTLGTVFVFPFCGVILKYYGWETVFLLSGLMSALWCLVWFATITDDPADHPWISRPEVSFIEKNRFPSKKTSDRSLPLWQMLKSPAVLVLIMCSCANDWGLTLLLTEGPNFIGKVLHKDIATIGFLSSLPYLGRYIMAIVSGVISDYLSSRPSLISKGNIRRLMFACSFLPPATGLYAMTFFTDSWQACIAVMTLGFSMNGFNAAAYMNLIDIAPSFTGSLMGLMNGMSAFAAFLAPVMAAHFTKEDPTNPLEWRQAFSTATIFYVAALICFCRFAKFEPLPFDKASKGDSKKMRVSNEEGRGDMELLLEEA